MGTIVNYIPQSGLLTVANASDIVEMNTAAGKPFFHVIVGDRDQWLVEAEWPDGTLEPVNTFKDHASAVNWVNTRSRHWTTLDTKDFE
jgi:hypothetical protein